MNLDEVRERLQRLAADAAGDDEQATVTITSRIDGAWSAEVSWVGSNGEREWCGYAGRLQDVEQHTAPQIAAREQRIDRVSNAPAPPPPPKPGEMIREIRPNDPFKWLRH